LCTFVIPHGISTPLRTGGAAVLEGSVLIATIVVSFTPGRLVTT
jgi:hypothetical protein